MTKHEVKHTGFVRTVSFLKAIDMFPVDKITKLTLERGVQTARLHEEYPNKKGQAPYFYRDTITIDQFRWEWETKVHGGRCPVDKVRKVIDKTGCGDYVIKEITVVICSHELVDYYNGILEMDAAKQKKKPILLQKDCSFYVTFRCTPSDELKKLDFIRELNRKEIDDYGFKLSALDLVHINTERAKKYGEREFIPVNDDPKMIKMVLRALDWTGWPEESRLVIKGTVRSYPNPAAVRDYMFGGTEGWVLVGQEEV